MLLESRHNRYLCPLNRIDPTTTAMSTKVVLMGAPPDTPNLGVSALGESTLDLLASQIDALHVLQFDFSRNKQATEPVRSGNGALVSHIGSNLSRRFWRSYSVANLNFASRVGRSTHPVIRWMRSASAVLDITGGDSFTDLYGKRRFKGSTLRKEIALRENPNLVLLPQTYGPFREQKSMRIASEIVKQASAAWARDARSFEILKSMLGEDFDPEIHRSGMDQAFGLDESPCMEELSPSMQAMFENNTSKLLIGLNVSGLIYNDPEAAEVQYGFKVDYGRLIRELIMRINANNDVLFSLVPHVLSPRGIIESDIAACEDVHEWCKSMKIDFGSCFQYFELPADEVGHQSVRLVLWDQDALDNCRPLWLHAGSSHCVQR